MLRPLANFQCKPLCGLRQRLLLLLTFVSFSDSTDVSLETTPSSSVFSSTVVSVAAEELGSATSSLGLSSALSGVAAGAADSALGLAGVFSASAVGDNKSKPHCFVFFKGKKIRKDFQELWRAPTVWHGGSENNVSLRHNKTVEEKNCYTIAKLVRNCFFLNLADCNLYLPPT